MPKKLPTKRSGAFVPQLIATLTRQTRWGCKFSELPSSYQAQPYNLPAKLFARGGINAKVVFNKDRDTFCIMRFGLVQKVDLVKPKTKKKTNHV